MNSPTGYWAIIEYDEYHTAMRTKAARRANTPPPDSIEILPVVTWTPDGWAAVFDTRGRLTPINRYDGLSGYTVTHEHPGE